ncbi:amidohydrolase family protein [Aeromicrobium sp. YIM 150415]|uniref:amidohydrolase family protein n=1 Tax=Aeromicrobium sp. YIM 150415 TaxID=2803912 RepID=UPI001962F806|nr:amidohydrolase family protein [Aeromicrobium sp. YIM 150415]MBM9463035.1 amidohydrolase family protein [Aeromicrobium sp. YIM 150415]
MTEIDLLIQNARLFDGRVVTIGIGGGRYRFVQEAEEPASGDAARTIDAGGALVTPSFVNGHLHLEKVYTLPLAGDGALSAYTSGAMDQALSSIVGDASAVKRHYDRSWIMPNVRRALDEAVRHGTLHLQAFVDVDTAAGLEGIESVLAVREEYRDLLDLQVVAFPQDGLLRDPGAAELCEEAMRLGADVVGGIPWIESTDRDARAHVEWACRLAASGGHRVAMLVDDAGDPALRTTEMLAEAMIDHGLQGRGVACHARALGVYPTPSVQRLTELARRAGLGFVSDPHTGPLHLPVREFLDDGLAVALGQDDIEDAYYPFGRNNMLEVAFLAAHLLRFLSGPDQIRLIELITDRAATVLGIEQHRIETGAPADLCVHTAERVVDLLRDHAAPRWVVRDGRIIAETETHTVIHR